MVVLGQSQEARNVTSVEVAATGDCGGGHVVAGQRVCVPRRVHGGEARGKGAVLWTSAEHLRGGTHDHLWGCRSWGGALWAGNIANLFLD